MKRPQIVVHHLLASLWIILTAGATGSTRATEVPATAAPAPGPTASLFAESREVPAVRVSTSDQLIAAMIAANQRRRPTIIRVAAGTYSFTQTFNSDFGASALPPVTGRVLIEGADASTVILDGSNGPGSRAFTVLAGGQLLLRGLTVQNFGFLNTCDNCTTIGGGAAENAGGDLRIENSVLTGNFVTSDGSGTFGGAILSEAGRLELQRTTVSSNLSVSVGGAGVAVTGGVAVLFRSILTGNSAVKGGGGDVGGRGGGGGLYVLNAKVTLLDSSVANNSAGPTDFDEPLGFGAGIWNDIGSHMWVVNSAIVNNHAGAAGTGGGILNTGNMTIINTTIGGNTVGSRGGGIDNGGTLTLQGTTIANNSEIGFPLCFDPWDADCFSGGNDLWADTGSTVNIATTTIGDCANATLTTDGHNAFGPGQVCTLQPANFLAHSSTHDQVNIEPMLGPLTDNGRVGNAHYPPLAGSPLIDAGGEIGRFCTPTDQIGERRVTVGDARDREPLCDVGAIEYQPHRR
ncbi:MAG TPA: choice-of-anchor Q domain-containing protein [Steroidobacteraceae bacterium]